VCEQLQACQAFEKLSSLEVPKNLLIKSEDFSHCLLRDMSEADQGLERKKKQNRKLDIIYAS